MGPLRSSCARNDRSLYALGVHAHARRQGRADLRVHGPEPCVYLRLFRFGALGRDQGSQDLRIDWPSG